TQLRVQILGMEIELAVSDGEELGYVRQRKRAYRRLPEQRFAVGQAHEGLGRHFTRQRPQARAGATGDDDGNEGRHAEIRGRGRNILNHCESTPSCWLSPRSGSSGRGVS